MQQAIKHIRNELCDLYPETEIYSFTNLLIEEITGFTRTQIIVNKNTIFSNEQRLLLDSFIQKLKKHVPIQYILEKTEFFGLEFVVNQSVLIPRPETEELVEWIALTNDKLTDYSILDIGTGSGCIAIGLKSLFPNANVAGIDISLEAINMAKKNAANNNLIVDFKQQDIFDTNTLNQKWDIIVSNPPYIPDNEKKFILPNVLNFEPHIALFVPSDNPLLFYKQIATFALHNLNKKGYLFFEIHRDFGKKTIELLHSLGFIEIELRQDIAGNDRMIKAKIS